MAYTNKKLTADNIEPHLDNTALMHNGITANIFKGLVTAGVNVSNLARAIGTRNETASKYRNLIREKLSK